MPVDPNEAPPGFIAVPYSGCGGCALRDTICHTTPCIETARQDKCDVQFVALPRPARPECSGRDIVARLYHLAREMRDLSAEDPLEYLFTRYLVLMCAAEEAKAMLK